MAEKEAANTAKVAIHNKNGKGLLLKFLIMQESECKKSQSTIKMEKGYYSKIICQWGQKNNVAIHNKNGKGLLLVLSHWQVVASSSQSTIKMEKGYYKRREYVNNSKELASQSTIKMEKGYYSQQVNHQK